MPYAHADRIRHRRGCHGTRTNLRPSGEADVPQRRPVDRGRQRAARLRSRRQGVHDAPDARSPGPGRPADLPDQRVPHAPPSDVRDQEGRADRRDDPEGPHDLLRRQVQGRARERVADGDPGQYLGPRVPCHPGRPGSRGGLAEVAQPPGRLRHPDRARLRRGSRPGDRDRARADGARRTKSRGRRTI